MKQIIYDVVVIGGGPAGMSSALSASKNGLKVLLIERANKLGGILNQCIHNGFGLKYFGSELTGPEYAYKQSLQIKKAKIKVLLNTFVACVRKGEVDIICENCSKTIKTKTIILAMGCREKTAGQIFLCGTRPVGIYTAGLAQKMINCNGKLPGKNVVVLGSGDIGLIMCRRLILQGAKVLGVIEIKKEASGLARNLRQCLQDFDIPLYLGCTITQVIGESRVEGVKFAPVDRNYVPILKKEKTINCDCVLLSVGLIPEIDLVKNFIQLDAKTKSTVVDQDRQTEIDGIFSCGNVLQIHDLADNASAEGELAGESSALKAKGLLINNCKFKIECDSSISHVIPQIITRKGDVELFFRVKQKINKGCVKLVCGKNVIFQKKYTAINAGELQQISVKNINCDAKLVIEEQKIN
ncbi:MAG: NAD(P)/FAD-dependent oxidoreductase [Clostridia bacterium]